MRWAHNEIEVECKWCFQIVGKLSADGWVMWAGVTGLLEKILMEAV